MGAGNRTLYDLQIGEPALVKKCIPTNYTCKLLTFGLLPDTEVRIVRKAPFGGTLYVKVNDHQIALRPQEAQSIFVQ